MAQELWRHPNFLKLWLGQTVSQFGAQITLVAFPLTAVLVLHASALQMGVLEAVGMAPFLVVGLPVGVWVDKLRRRPLLIAADATRLVLVGAVPLLYLAHRLSSIAILDAVQFLAGCMTVLFDVAYQSYLPAVVGHDPAALLDGNSKLEASRALAQVAGPSAGGALVAAVTAPLALAANAGTYLVSVVSLLLVRTEEPAPVRAAPRGMGREVADGLALVLKNPILASIAGATGTSNFFSSVMGAVYVLYAVHRVGLSPTEVGLTFGLGSVGGVLAAVVARRVHGRWGVGRGLAGAMGVSALGALLVPLAARPSELGMGVLVAGQVLVGLGATVYNIGQVSLRQGITRSEWLGRMNASMRFIVWGPMPLGSLLGGWLGSTWGLHPALWVGAAGGVLAPLWLLRTAVRRLQETPRPGAQPSL